MLKLKEVKAKSEDTGSKARLYLEGFLRIPFGVFKQEEMLTFLAQQPLRMTLINTLMEVQLNIP